MGDAAVVKVRMRCPQSTIINILCFCRILIAVVFISS